MSEFQKVVSTEELALLDQDAIVAGYLDGMRNPDEPGSDKCRGYWHGWRNAQIDKGRIPMDGEAGRLARSILGASVGTN